MKRLWLVISLFTGQAIFSQLFGTSIVFTQVMPRQDKFEKSGFFHVLVDQRMRKLTGKGFSGSVLIARKGRVLLHNGYGWSDKKHQYSITVNTQFCVASVSKQFTAAAILNLQEHGNLDINNPISSIIPGLPADKKDITVYQLLTHTSGIGQNYAADGITSRDKAIRAIVEIPLQNRPGEKFIYSDDGYVLLAVIIELISGETFENYLQRNLMTPAGMRQTAFWGNVNYDKPKQFAQIRGEISKEKLSPNWGFKGADGIISTTGDLYLWYQALRAEKVLSGKSVAQLFETYVDLGATQSALGWFRSKSKNGDRTLWTRGGNSWGHNAILVDYLDKDIILVVLSNAGEIEDQEWNRRVKEELESLISKSFK